MALPLAPAAGIIAKYGTVALLAYVAARRAPALRRSQPAEDALDEIDEGLSVRCERDQASVGFGYRRRVGLKHGGPTLEVDATFLARVKLRAYWQ
ncbi:MAG: hypothetical protein AAF330_08020 [Pseudomonadota bacterium]